MASASSNFLTLHDPDDKSNMILQHSGNYLPDNTDQQSPYWQYQIVPFSPHPYSPTIIPLSSTYDHYIESNNLSLPHHNTGYWFLLYWATSLVPWWDKCLNVSGDYMGGVICTICYPCAVCVLQGQNNIFNISVFVTYFLKLFYTCLLKY